MYIIEIKDKGFLTWYRSGSEPKVTEKKEDAKEYKNKPTRAKEVIEEMGYVVVLHGEDTTKSKSNEGLVILELVDPLSEGMSFLSGVDPETKELIYVSDVAKAKRFKKESAKLLAAKLLETDIILKVKDLVGIDKTYAVRFVEFEEKEYFAIGYYPYKDSKTHKNPVDGIIGIRDFEDVRPAMLKVLKMANKLTPDYEDLVSTLEIPEKTSKVIYIKQ